MIDLQNSKTGFSILQWNQLISSLPDSKEYRTRCGNRCINWFNLKLQYVPYCRELWIGGSLHKFYNANVNPLPIGPENYNDFTASQLKETILFLAKHFGKKPKDFELYGRFEYGVNIQTGPYYPSELIDSYISLGTTRINKFHHDNPHKGKPIGKICYFTEYRMKFYDKCKQAGISQRRILRYEIVNNGVGRLKRQLKKEAVTYEDLMDKKNLQILADSLVNMYDKVRKLPFNQGEVSRKIMQELHAYCEPKLLEYDKKRLSQWRFNQVKAKNKELMEDYSKHHSSPHYMVREKLVAKVNRIINNTPCNIGAQLILKNPIEL